MAYVVHDDKRTRSEEPRVAARRRSPDQARRVRTVRFALTEDEYAELSAAARQAGLARGANAAEATLSVARGAVTTPETGLRDAFYALDPGSGDQPAEDPPLATWLQVREGLTPHGYRHSQKTWMIEDGIPEILAEQRLGHQVPGMRGWYAHVSQRMRDELLTALQVRWEESLRQRAAIDPRSPLPLLDSLLAPYREGTAPATVHPIHGH